MKAIRCPERQRRCTWKYAYPRVANPFEVRYDDPHADGRANGTANSFGSVKHAKSPYTRSMRLRWEGSESLPAVFEPEDESTARYWAK